MNRLATPDKTKILSPGAPSQVSSNVAKSLNILDTWKSSFASASKGGFADLNDFVVRLQAISRTRLSKQRSNSPQLTLTRYARAEAAVRLALIQCEKEPTPLELQVRMIERGLQVWQTRVSRGYERVKRADEAIQALREAQEKQMYTGGSLSDLQREKWMGIKERDEALEMVLKIKALIAALNKEIKAGSKRSSLDTLSSSASSHRPQNDEPSTPVQSDTASKKASILFSGRIPPPYLDNLPRSRQNVEPLQLPELQRQRNSLSSPQSAPSSVPPTPTASERNEYGAVVIHPTKSVDQYLAEMESNELSLEQLRLPSYVDTLLDELGADPIDPQIFTISTDSLLPLSSSTSSNVTCGSSPATKVEEPNSIPTRARPHKLLRRSVVSLPKAKENLKPLPSVTSDDGPSTPRRKQAQIDEPVTPRKKSSKMENVMRSVKKSVTRVSSRLGD